MALQNKGKKQDATFTSKSSGRSMSQDELNAKIQAKAYELYQKKGCTPGNEWNDWFEAERIVKSGR
jgi:hypothetical protein